MQHLSTDNKTDLLRFDCTSFMTCRTAGVSGAYSNFPKNSGLIPRHTTRDKGLDSRPWIKLLQNGAAQREGETKWDKCWTEKGLNVTNNTQTLMTKLELEAQLH